ncbi:hypothetical protein W97_08165 [Coniosporium apollinis CBS 100218]|uniref:FAD-binding domain-containing protein n=1 Tax=Coniosporium apollinis (strain CBS 100218) TaxID=1168221 RepID=R7Z411_CONA1|nr:uncharacterized protein W97_08165 [Coniosporium apollinis CBS 100218]EON68907.1 hypothetical protein W97_08165 [Coniosporium apollinis CBS 100218]
MTAPTQKPFDVAVVGGGIAGVTLVIGLLHNRVPVTLYEAAPRFGEIGAGVAFGPNAVRAMKLIDPRIAEGFAKVATQNQWESKRDLWFDFRYGDGTHAEKHGGEVRDLIHPLYCPGGQAYTHRAHFLDEMVKLVPDGVAVFGKRLVDIEDKGGEEGVLLKFADGSTARHSAVIGCDGIKSRTREIVLGKEHPAARAVYSGKYAYRGLIPMEKAAELLGDELARNGQLYMGQHGHVLTFAIEKGKTMNVVAFSSSETWDSDNWVVTTNKDKMMADFAGWSKSVESILTLMQKTDIWALFNHPPCETYYKGRVCIQGDAAHGSTPHQGSGAGMAIEDSYVLSNLVAAVEDASGIESAFEAFDAVRRERTQRLVKTSREAGQLYDFELPGVLDDVEKIRKNLDGRMGWIWYEDMQAELEKGKRLMSGRSSL